MTDDPHLRAGLNVCDGHITYEAVALALGLPMCRRPAYWHDVTAFVTGQPLTARAAGCVHAPFAPPPRFDAPPAPIVRASSGLTARACACSARRAA